MELVNTIKEMNGLNGMDMKRFKEITEIKSRIKYDDVILYDRMLYRYDRYEKCIKQISNRLNDVEMSEAAEEVEIAVYLPE